MHFVFRFAISVEKEAEKAQPEPPKSSAAAFKDAMLMPPPPPPDLPAPGTSDTAASTPVAVTTAATVTPPAPVVVPAKPGESVFPQRPTEMAAVRLVRTVTSTNRIQDRVNFTASAPTVNMPHG